MIFPARIPLFVVVSALAALAPTAAPTLAADTPSDTRPRLLRGSVQPQWLPDQTRFWYRNDGPNATREFLLVDAAAGQRELAFDHQRLAQSLAIELGEDVDSKRLPIGKLTGVSDESMEFQGPKGHWSLHLSDYRLTRVDGKPSPSDSLPFDRKPRPSRRTGAETEVRFENRLDQPVELFWIDPSGERRSYGKLAAGEARDQHTYDGHVWLVAGAESQIVAVFEAEDRPHLAVIDSREPDRVSRRGARRSRERRAASQRAQSPDGRWEAFSENHNLCLRSVENGQQRVLTSDGTPERTWRRDVGRARGVQMRYDMADPPDDAVEVYWSPDSKHVIAIQTQTAPERRVHLVESAPKDGTQPRLHSYPYFKPGDVIPVQRPGLFDVESGEQIEVDQTLFPNPFNISDIRWTPDSSHFTFVYNERGHQVLRILRVEAAAGQVTAVVEERSDTFIDYAGKYFVHYLDDSGELIWMSERDGWNHLYLIDATTGDVKSQLTQGAWTVRRVDRVDEETREVWIRVGGIHPGQDPYHVHFARVNFAGDELVVLTHGDGTHQIEHSPNQDYLIDKWSRVDLPPVHELRRTSDGTHVCDLEKAEILGGRHRLPERFVSKGRDGKTDIFGIVHWPVDYDEAKSYPIVENIYAGPHSAHVPKSFRLSYGHQQEIADRGLVVVQIDGMGTSHRSKSFHDVCWRNLGDAGLPDRVLWIKALAERHASLDDARVGIYGGSAGGQSSLGALLTHGAFYSVAVADCGCHDNRMDKIWWNELWMGWPVGPHYDEQSNVTRAHRLQGKLLLVVGELDRNVDPASTMQVVRALIDADKDFDLLVVPGGGHGIAESPYGKRRRADYFVEHLLKSR